MAAIGRRVILYWRGAAVLAGISAVCLLGAWFFWLPAADSNAAFDQVSLLDAASALHGMTELLARRAPRDYSPSSWEYWFWAIFFNPFTLLGVPVVLILVFRGRARLLFAGLVGCLAIVICNEVVLSSKVTSPVTADKIDALMRSRLQRSVGATTPDQIDGGVNPITPLERMVATAMAGNLHREITAALKSQSMTAAERARAEALLREVDATLSMLGKSSSATTDDAKAAPSKLPSFGNVGKTMDAAANKDNQALAQRLMPGGKLPSFGDLAKTMDSAAANDANRDPLAGLGPTVAGMTIDPSVAAYTLAQIAYLENHPDEASRMLGEIVNPDALPKKADQQRVDIMREWVAARGYPVSPDLWPPQTRVPMRYVRFAARILLGCGLAFAALSLIPLLLSAVAEKRRRRIGRLVEARRAGQLAGAY
jgi:hypothetical protein